MSSPWFDAPTLTWVDPLGVEYPLNLASLDALGFLAAAGVAGLGVSPVEFATDPMPRGGTSVRHIQPLPRIITLPIYVEGATHDLFIDVWRRLANSFAITRRRGPGHIIVARPSGERRKIECHYQDGFDHAPDMPATRDLVVLSLYCPVPFWEDLTPTEIVRGEASGVVSFLSPFLTLSSSQTLGSTTALNPGGVEAWPRWTIKGPASNVQATNMLTGESWTLDPVAFRGSARIAGETVTITTEPPTVTGPAVSGSTNWAGALNFPGAILWALEPGDNPVVFTVAGSGVGTEITADFFARHETA